MHRYYIIIFLTETHPCNHPSFITPAIQLTICVHPSIHACVCVSVCACMHICMCLHAVSVHSIMCSAGPEVAVLDWYGPVADPVYWWKGEGGAWWWQDSR